MLILRYFFLIILIFPLFNYSQDYKNDYKNQLNQVILEIQTQLTNIENPTNIENISQN